MESAVTADFYITYKPFVLSPESCALADLSHGEVDHIITSTPGILGFLSDKS